jgi:excisionase family DNA binding protein
MNMVKNVPDTIMTVHEVSEYLKLAESTVYKLAQEGKLPGRKIGGTWRFSRNGLDEWFKEGPAALSNRDGRKNGLE